MKVFKQHQFGDFNKIETTASPNRSSFSIRAILLWTSILISIVTVGVVAGVSI
jgi:uncharacterized membrane protein YvbJ